MERSRCRIVLRGTPCVLLGVRPVQYEMSGRTWGGLRFDSLRAGTGDLTTFKLRTPESPQYNSLWASKNAEFRLLPPAPAAAKNAEDRPRPAQPHAGNSVHLWACLKSK
jgi:hypothetical protein